MDEEKTLDCILGDLDAIVERLEAILEILGENAPEEIFYKSNTI